ncbi:MAG: peptide ABC transporter substrate-binding protein [Candidatus Eisenbacteria bacterium]|uniref:Peptide ABC transporter substrate-binding protein n=1 Tax=Eiseniibacteriota bacterium TaxID=2212470 RepID=A0A9D6L8F5_UNCEI|nr:peptide ABC transporter substrate-binding protein [Candidatus Eisenbacteria bacterium]MBI3539565.1 peptide ABC transporter substrate-binding protein [Candidatus Eisenbacteria bacterium]
MKLPRVLGLAALASLLACAPAARRPVAANASAPRWFGSTALPPGNVLRFNLGAEPETYDPDLAVGQPDGRVARMLFEGLTREDPQTLEPLPGEAYRWEISGDGRTYTFHLRPGIRWTDGRPVTAEDFRWSWIRLLEPKTTSRYASFLFAVTNAEAFNKGDVKDERAVGLAAPDDSTLIVRLDQPVPYFLYLCQFYSCLPVPRRTVERFGNRWTLPANIVGNGAFTLTYWRQNNRFEFAKNPAYWDAASVHLDRVVGYTIDDLNTSFNLYKAGVIDWCPSGYFPSSFIPYVRGYADYHHGDYQGVYFYTMCVKRPPIDNVWVRRALNAAVDREAIAQDLLKGSRRAWGDFVPTGYPGYENPPGLRFDPAYARQCLTRAGYPGGKGFPRGISILINTSEDNRRIAEAVQAMWKRELGIDVAIQNEEWGSYLQTVTALKYDVARRSWLGDYLDPNTFLACYVTGDGNNRSGWGDPRYDAMIRAAAKELDAKRRFAILRGAEALLLADGPVIPVYHYSTNELVKPYVRGIYQTPLDVHPLTHVWIDRDWRRGPPPVASASPPAPRSKAITRRAAAREKVR